MSSPEDQIKELEKEIKKLKKEGHDHLSTEGGLITIIAKLDKYEAKIGKLEKKIDRRPSYSFLFVVLLIVLALGYFDIISPTPERSYVKIPDKIYDAITGKEESEEETATVERKRKYDKPDPMMIFDRIFGIMEKAMEQEAARRAQQPNGINSQ